MIQAGYRGQIALEITNHGPFTVSLGEGIPFCQLIVEALGRPAGAPYSGQFQDQQQST
jgi:deoxycytidine triphosphate deaminase